jgi:DNA (cytosine-5)-methyltransferase 1
MLTLVDLFCGTGAFSLAFHATGKVHTVFANDMLDSSEAIFNANNSTMLTKKSIHDIDVINEIPEGVDIITAGFPCQPFSIAGNKKGFNDVRSNVFWKILEVIDTRRPRVVILENVKNLVTHDKGNTFSMILSSLKNLGYFVAHKVINTCAVTSVPQNRERIYVVCFRDEVDFNRFDFNFPATINEPINSFLEDNVPDRYYYKESSKIYEKLEADVKKNIDTNTVYQYRRYYVRENKNGVCPTLTENMGSGGHNVPIILDTRGIRKLTPCECFNLQGFPSDYILPKLSDSRLYSLAGNTLSVPVVKLLACRIVSAL